MRSLGHAATALACLAWQAGGLCAPTDDPEQCSALVSVGVALRIEGWEQKANWMTNQSFCTWEGITCGSTGQVTNLTLEKNGLRGYVPPAIGGLRSLQSFNINGKRPSTYHGCQGNDLQHSALPAELFSLRNLTTLFAENACIGGTIPRGVGQLRKLQIAKLHNNAISGTIPVEFNGLPELRWFDLGRNALSGTFPDLRDSHKLEKFSCNFCALTGTVPDIFDGFPNLQHTFWDGNALSGSLPPSLGSPNLKKLCCVSFDINRMSGAVPPGLCELPALTDCRIGADVDAGAYLGAGNDLCAMPFLF